MPFDMVKFVNTLKKEEKRPKSDYGRGVYLVLDYVFLHSESEDVDFDGFTEKDAEIALREAYGFPFDEIEDGFQLGISNALLDYEKHYKVINALHGIKREYVSDDDFI